MTAAVGRGPPVDVTLKISLAGDPAVGKTSLVRRFVSNTFDERYVSTLGTRVASRQFPVDDPQRPAAPLRVGAALWDIMGSHDFRTLLKEAFFSDADAVLLVCDRTFPESFYNLPEWYETIASVAGHIPAVVLLNKCDLDAPTGLPASEVEKVCKGLRWPWFATSAKTGENVDAAFRSVAEEYLKIAKRPTAPRIATS